jgi:pimeloyl-ACP methyl ester carboxylesterase
LFTGDSVGQALADALPHAHFHVLRDCGHLPTLEEPAECAVLFFEFLDDKTQHARD